MRGKGEREEGESEDEEAGRKREGGRVERGWWEGEGMVGGRGEEVTIEGGEKQGERV